MSTLIITLIVISILALCSFIYGINGNTDTHMRFGVSGLTILVITGIIGFGFVANVLIKYDTTEQIYPKIIKDKHTSTVTVLYVNPFDGSDQTQTYKSEDFNQINGMTKWYVTQRYNHYNFIHSNDLTYKTPEEHLYSDSTSVEVIQYKKDEPTTHKIHKENVMLK